MVVMRDEELGILITNDNPFTNPRCVSIDPGTNTFTMDELAAVFDGAGGFTEDLFTYQGITYEEVGRNNCFLKELGSSAFDSSIENGGSAERSYTRWLRFVVQWRNATAHVHQHLRHQVRAARWLAEYRMDLPTRRASTDVSYRLDIVRIDMPDGRVGDANDAMLSATVPELFTQVYDASPAMIEIPDELMLEAGFHYAVRVTAFIDDSHPDGGLLSQSEVCSFLYAPEGIGGGGILQAVYPVNDDIIPFRHFPIIAKFSPYDNYTGFTFTTTVNDLSGTRNMPVRTGSNNGHQQTGRGAELPARTEPQDERGTGPASTEPIRQRRSCLGGRSFERGVHYQWRTFRSPRTPHSFTGIQVRSRSW